MDYVIYTDESRHDGPVSGPFMGIGGLWVARSEKDRLTKALQQLRREVGLTGEIKWTKVSALKLESYKRLIDFFLTNDFLRFRIILVEKSKLDHSAHNDGDHELGFYKFYYEMLVKWMESPHRYLVLLDFKTNKGSDRFGELKRVLKNGMPFGASILDLTVNDSFQSPLAQLADLLTGCVTAAWCNQPPTSAKGEIVRYLEAKSGVRLILPSASPRPSKLNIFRINL
ncbi:MAG: DUF3800 domain-containing protein [Verrucomicrobia bacterium]|nr:DUF3800 domain-containing protein [Verrucomicrobiota bacterium]